MNEILLLCLMASIATSFILTYYYKKYRVDAYRQEIFSIRDELFMFAAKGGIAFDHPAYTMTRTYLNGTIRYTERLSLVKVVLAHSLLHQHRSHFESDFRQVIEGLNNDQLRVISEARNKTAIKTIIYLVDKNVFLLFIAEAIYYLNKVRRMLWSSRVKESLTKQYKDTYDDLIYKQGSSDNMKLTY